MTQVNELAKKRITKQYETFYGKYWVALAQQQSTKEDNTHVTKHLTNISK